MLLGLNVSDNFIEYVSHRFSAKVKDCSLTDEDKFEKIDFYIDDIPIQFKSRTTFSEINLEIGKYLPYSDKLVPGRDTKIKADYLIFFSEVLPFFAIIPIDSIEKVIAEAQEKISEINLKKLIESRTKPNKLLYKDKITIILHQDTNHHGVLYKIVAYCPLELFEYKKVSFNGDSLMQKEHWKNYDRKSKFKFKI